MNEIVGKFLLSRDEFILRLHLRQPVFIYNTFRLLSKHRQRIQKFKETGDLNDIYKNKLEKVCIFHDVAYSDSKDLAKRTASDKALKDKQNEISLNFKYDGYQRGLESMVYKFCDKQTRSGAISTSTARVILNEVLVQELHNPVIKKFKKRKVCSRLKENILAVDLVEMGSLSTFYCGVNYVLCVIDIFIKHAWVKPLTDQKAKTVLNGFMGIVY